MATALPSAVPARRLRTWRDSFGTAARAALTAVPRVAGRATRSGIARFRAIPPAVVATGFAGLMIVGLTVPVLWRDGAPKTPSVVADVGTADFSYAANGVKAPTGRKPESSKLWFNDGVWWGILFRRTRDAYVINRFDATSGSWVDTGTIVDDRNFSRADVLWDGQHLYTVSGGQDPTSDKEAAIVSRFSYDSGTRAYTLDRGFPVRITDGGSETFVFDRDEQGHLWVTYTRDQTVFVTHSLQTDRDWTEPFRLPAEQAERLTPDDIAAVVAYDGHVGVMWSDQSDGAMYFASHPNGAPDTEWSVSAAIQGPLLADDHMNLKALHDDPAGLVVAIVKTSRNDAVQIQADDPLIVLMVLRHDGTWEYHTVGDVGDNQTRPLLAIDSDHRMLYVFYSAPCCSGGSIYYKASPLDDIQFPSGAGTAFMRRGRSSQLNNPASTKQLVNSESGLLVVAADDRTDYYLHNFLPLTGPLVPAPSVGPIASPRPGASGDPGQQPLTRWFTETFEAKPDTVWSFDRSERGAIAAVETGNARTDRRALHLRSIGTDKSYAVADVTLPPDTARLAASFDIRIATAGAANGNVPLVRLLDENGQRLATVYRQNTARGRIWISTGDQHIPTDAELDLQTWARVTVRILPGTANPMIEVRLDGILANQVELTNSGPIGRVQWGNSSKNQAFDVYLDNVTLDR